MPPQMSRGDATEGGNPSLAFPQTLEASVGRLRESEAARSILGERFVDHYARTREWECREYRKSVSEWELRRYFEST